jgi:hypothetical protein
MTQFLTIPVDKSLGATGTWTDIDLSANVPVGATGAIFQVRNLSGVEYDFGLRKKGSADNRYYAIDYDGHLFCIIGIDGNRKCQGKIESTNVDFHLVGYTEIDATLFTNAYDKSQTTTTAWTDLDLSSELPAGSVAAIFQIYNSSDTARSWSLRKKGSTDERYDDLAGYGRQMYAIVGVDANRKCQFKIESTFIDFFLLGYLSSGEAETNGVDRSLGSTGSYVDITETGAPNGATGAFVDVATTSGAYQCAARKNGVSTDIYDELSDKKASIFVGLDGDKKWEGKIENTGVDFYTLGYFSGGVTEKNSSDAGVGVDAQAELLSSCSEQDTGVGVDAALGIQAALINADVGAGADAILESLASRLESDTGTGVDVLVDLLKVIAKYSSDTGVGADAISEQLAALIQADTGTGADALLSRLFSSSDEGIGVDATFNLLATIVASDEGVGVDGLSALVAAIEQSDVGSGVEGSSIVIWMYLLLKLLQTKEISMKLSHEKLLSMKLSHEKLLSMKLSQKQQRR